MDTLLRLLRDTVQCAYERSVFYHSLYSVLPEIATIGDFARVPTVNDRLLAQANGATDLVSLEDGQLVMELNGLSSNDTFPYTPLENEYDMDRRYRRVLDVLERGGADPAATIVIATEKSLYFAAEIERVLPWPIAIVLCDPSGVSTGVSRLPVHTIIDASNGGLASIPPSCRLLITFNCGNQQNGHDVLPECLRLDVLTLRAIPWLAVSADAGGYDTLDAVRLARYPDSRQFYLEQGDAGTLVVTVLNAEEEPGAMPIVRYDTGLAIDRLTTHAFSLVS